MLSVKYGRSYLKGTVNVASEAPLYRKGFKKIKIKKRNHSRKFLWTT